ncbi:MAG: flagellar basal body P-ring formation protein FlgA [Planctomycetes bacterium]|nr:flagellar basal body P-ring formation protein FlgA [Planctomycetota bacterium]
MTRIGLILIALTPLAQGQTQDWESVSRTVRATLHERATVRGLDLRLGDVADVTGIDATTVAKARQLRLGNAPGPGRIRLLGMDTLRGLVAQAAGSRMDIRLDGAMSVQVLPETVKLSSDEIGTLARRWLWNALGWRGNGTNVRPVATPGPLETQAGRWSTRFEVIQESPNAHLVGLVKLRVRAVVDGKPGASVPVSLVVKRRHKVLVVARRVPAGRPLSSEDVKVEERMADGTSPDALTEMSALHGLITRRALTPGKLISSRDLKGRPVVFRNDPVTVRVLSGALAVTGTGRAMEEGAPGEVIIVRTGNRGRTVHAVVIDSGTVEVRFDTAKETK